MKSFFPTKLLYFLISLFIIRKPRQTDHEKIYVIFSEIYLPENYFLGDLFTMQLKEGQKATINVVLKTKRGHQAAIEPGSASFESSDPSVVQVRQNPTNELSAEIEAIDGSANESVVVTFRADGKIGDGVRELVGTLDVVATQGDAFVVEMEVGEITDAPDATPETETPPASDPAAPVLENQDENG